MNPFAKKHLVLLEFLEELKYWRKRQACGDKGLRFGFARVDWIALHRDDFRAKLETGWLPDLVTGFWDILPLSKHDLRLLALLHDIDYTLGGTIEDRWAAYRRLLLGVLMMMPGSRYLLYVAAPLIFIAVRCVGWRGHFCYRDQEAREILKDVSAPWEWKALRNRCWNA